MEFYVISQENSGFANDYCLTAENAVERFAYLIKQDWDEELSEDGKEKLIQDLLKEGAIRIGSFTAYKERTID